MISSPWLFFVIVLFSVCLSTLLAARRMSRENNPATQVRAEHFGAWMAHQGLDSLDKKLWAIALTFEYLFDRAFLGRQSAWQQMLWVWIFATLLMLPFSGFGNQVSVLFELDDARFDNFGVMVLTLAVGISLSIGMALGRIGSRKPQPLVFSTAGMAAVALGFLAVLGIVWDQQTSNRVIYHQDTGIALVFAVAIFAALGVLLGGFTRKHGLTSNTAVVIVALAGTALFGFALEVSGMFSFGVRLFLALTVLFAVALNVWWRPHSAWRRGLIRLSDPQRPPHHAPNQGTGGGWSLRGVQRRGGRGVASRFLE